MTDASFLRSMVRAPLPQDWETVSEHHPGYCYLCLYKEEHRQKVAHMLGVYPTWRSVKALGGHKHTGLYRVTRVDPQSVHIGSESMGYPITYLKINDNDVLGNDARFHTTAFQPTPLWRHTLIAWAIWFIGRALVFTKLPHVIVMVIASFMLVFPTWILELMFGRLHVPDVKWIASLMVRRIKRALPDRLKNTWSQSRDITKISKLMKLLCMFILPTVAVGRLSTKPIFDLETFNLESKDTEIIKVLHPVYVKTHSSGLPDSSLCTTRTTLRLELLSLDVDDDPLMHYIEGMCPQLKGREWWMKAEAQAIADDGSTIKIWDYGLEKADQISDATDNAVTNVKSRVSRLTDESSDALASTVDSTVDTVIELTKLGGRLFANGFEAIVEALGDRSEVPGEMFQEILSMADIVGNRLKPKQPFDNAVSWIDTLSNRLNEISPMLISDVDQAIGQIAEDTRSITVETYSKSRDLVQSKYKELSESDASLRDVVRSVSDDVKFVTVDLYTSVKDSWMEIDPLVNTIEVAQTGVQLSRSVGNAAGGLIAGVLTEFQAVIPSTEGIQKFRTLIIGEPVTSKERMAKAESRSKWTIGSLTLWRPYGINTCKNG